MGLQVHLPSLFIRCEGTAADIEKNLDIVRKGLYAAFLKASLLTHEESVRRLVCSTDSLDPLRAAVSRHLMASHASQCSGMEYQFSCNTADVPSCISCNSIVLRWLARMCCRTLSLYAS